jgi:hypothetical protein
MSGQVLITVQFHEGNHVRVAQLGQDLLNLFESTGPCKKGGVDVLNFLDLGLGEHWSRVAGPPGVGKPLGDGIPCIIGVKNLLPLLGLELDPVKEPRVGILP